MNIERDRIEQAEKPAQGRSMIDVGIAVSDGVYEMRRDRSMVRSKCDEEQGNRTFADSIA